MIPHYFHPEADAELEDAAEFYESQVTGLGKAFSKEIERTVRLVREFHMQAHRRDPGVDAFSLTGSPTPSYIDISPIRFTSWRSHTNADAPVTGAAEPSV